MGWSAQGVAVSDTEDSELRLCRADLHGLAERVMGEVVQRLSLDAAADRMAVAFLQQRLPPPPAPGKRPMLRGPAIM